VVGEPGLGKSRLIAEWKTAVSMPNWFVGQCLSYGQGLAYHLLIDLLRPIIDVPAADDEKEAHAALYRLTETLFGDKMSDVYPYLGHLLSLRLEEDAEELVKKLDPQALQAHYLAALRQLLQTLAGKTPLTLVFEDIHWADPSSTALIGKLMDLAAEAPILFCFVTRPEPDRPGWGLTTIASDQFSAITTELNLHALEEADSQQLITNLLEIEALPDNVRELILEKAEGNPFFVEEVIRMLIDRQMIVSENGRWVAQEAIDTVEIPDNLQGLLLARIDRLPENVKYTLRVASVIGRQFSVRLLEEVLKSI